MSRLTRGFALAEWPSSSLLPLREMKELGDLEQRKRGARLTAEEKFDILRKFAKHLAKHLGNELKRCKRLKMRRLAPEVRGPAW
jgi:hypothetical protein